MWEQTRRFILISGIGIGGNAGGFETNNIHAKKIVVLDLSLGIKKSRAHSHPIDGRAFKLLELYTLFVSNRGAVMACKRIWGGSIPHSVRPWTSGTPLALCFGTSQRRLIFADLVALRRFPPLTLGNVSAFGDFCNVSGARRRVSSLCFRTRKAVGKADLVYR